MTDDTAIQPSAPDEQFPVARPPQIGKPHVDEFRLGEQAAIQHRGHRYQITLVADDTWAIRSEDGRTMGSVFMVSPAGEEGEPVYGVRQPGSMETAYEGTAWRSITAAVINEVLEADESESE